jgi:cephalosporin hydroxylase
MNQLNHLESFMTADGLSLKQLIKPLVPVGLLDAYRSYKAPKQNDNEVEKRAKFERIRGNVLTTISAIRSLTPQQCSDNIFLEQTFIPSLGLNDEMLNEQPVELSSSFGSGLHIWQYPKQLAPYLIWLSDNAKDIKCYMEIGCRWGGMFILVSEWLRKNGANLDAIIAVDPIKSSPFIDEYFNYLKNEKIQGHRGIEAIYIGDFSTSAQVSRLVERVKPDMVFIDGDHSLKGALLDHMLVRDYARIIVHHDVNSQSCPDTTLLWDALKNLDCHDFDFFEFIDQYNSVNGKFLGIGTMKRKEV